MKTKYMKLDNLSSYKVKENIIDNKRVIESLSVFNENVKPCIVRPFFETYKVVDKNYKRLQFCFEKSNYWISAMYDDKDNFIQIYIDITKENFLDDKENPHCLDWYLDIVIRKGNVYLIDQDELLESTDTTSTEKQLALEIGQKVFNFAKENLDKIIQFCTKELKSFQKK